MMLPLHRHLEPAAHGVGHLFVITVMLVCHFPMLGACHHFVKVHFEKTLTAALPSHSKSVLSSFDGSPSTRPMYA